MARYSDVKSGTGQPWFDGTTCLDADPQFINAITTPNDITLDGILDESFWSDAASVVVGLGSSTSKAVITHNGIIH